MGKAPRDVPHVGKHRVRFCCCYGDVYGWEQLMPRNNWPNKEQQTAIPRIGHGSLEGEDRKRKGKSLGLGTEKTIEKFK